MSQATGVRDVSGQRWRVIRWGSALLLAVLAAWLSIRQVRWVVFDATLTHVHVPLLTLALGTVLATTTVKAVRWHVLLRTCGTRASATRSLRVLLIGQMGNSLLPGRVGELARAALIGPQTEGGFAAALGTIVVEKTLDAAMGLAVLVGLVLWVPLPSWLRQVLVVLGVVTCVLLVVLALAATQRDRAERIAHSLNRRASASGKARAARMLSGLAMGLSLFRNPATACLALALSVGVWSLAALTNVVTLAALDIQAPGWSTWLVLVTGYVATFLPTVPAQVGVFEYACVLALTAAGVDPEPALAFGLVLHLLVFLPPAVLGPISMGYEGLSWNRLKDAQDQHLEQDGVRG
jgi:uncharacterized protein (TIRG00374 family)